MTAAANPIAPGTSAYRRANGALFIAGFVTFSTLYDFQPLLPVLAREFAVMPATASLALSAATFALAVTLPAAGSLSDALGRRRLMGTAVLATAVLALATAVCDTAPQLIALRLLQGAVLAGVPGVAMAYLAEEIEPGAVGRAMGLYIAGNALGGMCGRIGTAWLADFIPWRSAIAVIGGVSLLLALLFIALLPPSRRFERRPFHLEALTVSLLGHLREPGLRCLFTVAFAGMGAFVTLYNYVTFRLLAPPYALSQSQVALIFLAYAIGAGGSSHSGAAAERFGRGRLLAGALATMAGGAVLTAVPTVLAIVAGVVVFTVGFFAAHAVASAWVGQRASKARAQAASLYLFCYYLGSSIAGTAGGVAWTLWAWNGVVILMLALVGVAATALWRLTRLPPLTAPGAAAPQPLP